MYVCYIIFTPFGYGVLFANNNFRIKIGGGWARGASNIFGTPYVYLQPLKLATSNLVHNLGLGLAYQKQRLGPKLAGVWARGANVGPLRISATVQASNSNLVHNLGLGLAYQNNV